MEDIYSYSFQNENIQTECPALSGELGSQVSTTGGGATGQLLLHEVTHEQMSCNGPKQ